MAILVAQLEMTNRLFPAWLFPSVSLGLGIAYRSYGDRFWSLLARRSPLVLLTIGGPLLLLVLFGFLRPRPKEIWTYGFLMWLPGLMEFVPGVLSEWWHGYGLPGVAPFIFLIIAILLFLSARLPYIGLWLRRIVCGTGAD